MAGENAIFRYGFERSEGVQGATSVYVPFTSETFRLTPSYEMDPAIDGSGNETEGEDLQYAGAGKLTSPMNTESLLSMRYHHHGYGEVSTPVAGVKLHELRDFDPVGDTPLAFYADSLWFGAWRDIGTEYVGLGAKCTDFTLSVDPNKFFQAEHDFLYLRDRKMRNPTPNAVNVAYTGSWVVRGFDPGANAYRKFKIVTPGVLGVATYVTGEGADPYGTTEHLITDEWLTFFDSDDLVVGVGKIPRRNPMQIRPIFSGVFTADDEWYIYPTSPIPVKVFSERPKLAAPDLEVRYSKNGGVSFTTINVDNFSLKMTRPREAKFRTGSVYAQTIGKPDNAKKSWELSFGRDYVNDEFWDALRAGTRMEVHSKAYGALIGATGLEEFAEYTLETMRLSQAGATTTTAGDIPETVTMRAVSINGSPLCIERYQNTVASVAP